MGWKKFKQHFEISHHIQVCEGLLMIGSSYVHNIVKINMKTGSIDESSTFRGFLQQYYPKLASSTQAEILQLIKEKDEFENDLKVYSLDSKLGIVKESLCEIHGWPNLTHDGEMMYNNTHFISKREAVNQGLKSLNSLVEYYENDIDVKKELLLKLETNLQDTKNKILILEKSLKD